MSKRKQEVTSTTSAKLPRDNVTMTSHGHGNPHLESMAEDVLYHFALGTKSHDLPVMFGDVKFVVVGGSPRRMERFAQFMLKELNYKLPAGQTLTNIAGATDRYALYKVGPILMASHGMGIPSISIMMHEIIKLVFHAGCRDVTFFRVGTCGGLGLDPGTVVVTETAVDGLLRPYMEMHILGKTEKRPSVLDRQLATELVGCSDEEHDGFQTILGKTMCTTDFYEGQGRLDGAICQYTKEDKLAFLTKCHAAGVRNIEMESLCFAAICHMVGIKGAVACVAILDRLKGDQVDVPRETLHAWDQRPATIVARWIRKQLHTQK